MHPRISIWGSVCQSVRQSVRLSVGNVQKLTENVIKSLKSQDMDSWLQITIEIPLNHWKQNLKKRFVKIILKIFVSPFGRIFVGTNLLLCAHISTGGNACACAFICMWMCCFLFLFPLQLLFVKLFLSLSLRNFVCFKI